MSEYRSRRPTGRINGALIALVTAGLIGCTGSGVEQADGPTTESTAGDITRRADQVRTEGRLAFPVTPIGIEGVEVASFVEDVAVERRAPGTNFEPGAMRAERPRPAAARRRGTGPSVDGRVVVQRGDLADGQAVTRRGRRTRSTTPLPAPPSDEQTTAAGSLSIGGDPTAQAANPFVVQRFDGVDFDQNANLTGFFSIPPDPHIAAGPNHVMTVVNTTVQAFTKTGGVVLQESLRNFFAPLGPLTGTFDPKVLFDTQAGRWVVVTLEQTDQALGDAADTSRIFVAASDDADPAGNWSMTAVDARTMIGGTDHWADFPGLGVDEEAIYITTNMFQFFSNAGNFGGVRLWIVPKGALYNGQAVNVRRVNPYTNQNSFALTTQPAQFYGNSAGVGGMLLGYSGLSNTQGESFVQVMRVNNPLGAVQVVGPEFVNLGQIEEIAGFPPLPDATQNGNPNLIVTNDRRMLNAVWIDGMLYGAFTVRSNGEATAYWAEMAAGPSGTPTVARQASIPGEQLGGGTHTYYPAVAANARGDVIVGYSASNPSIFAGSYYSIYPAGDDVSTVGEPQLLHAGEGGYFRQFGSSNRWGDYSGAVVDPVDGCFWVFNEHAGIPGTPVGQGDGRWETSGGKVCLALGFAQSPDSEEATSDSEETPPALDRGRTRPLR